MTCVTDPSPWRGHLGNMTMTFIKNFIADESGASAAEYALIIAIVGVGIGAAALVLGNNVTNAIGESANEVNECNSASSADGSTSVSWTPGASCTSAV